MSILLSLLGSNVPTGGDSGWPDISTAAFVRSDTVNIGLNPLGIFFKPDGTKVYTINTADQLVETNLSTAWDISTHGTAVNTMTTDQTYNISPGGFWFSTDGTNLFVADRLYDRIVQYELTTAWDISTASYLRLESVQAQQGSLRDVCFDDSGLNMYIVGQNAHEIDRFTLTTAWNISTISHHSNSASINNAPLAAKANGVFIKPDDGTKIYVVDDNNNQIVQWNLSTPYDISSDVDSTGDDTFSATSQETSPWSMYISPDGSHLYVAGTAGDDINQYSLG